MKKDFEKVPVVERGLACLECSSSDARELYEDGHSHCYSCGKTFGVKKLNAPTKAPPLFKKSAVNVKIPSLEEIGTYLPRGFQERGITKKVCEFFGVKVSYNENGEIDTHYYPYADDKGLTGYKIRMLPKSFAWAGSNGSKLFGKDKFASGGKRLIVCEGEIDTLSVAQAMLDHYDKIYPVIGLSSATGTQALLENRDWIRSFGEVVLCCDNDPAGEESKAKSLKIVGIDKAKIAKFSLKDANDVLVTQGYAAVMRGIWDAERYKPVGILRKKELWDALVAYNDVKSMPYPPCLDGLNTKLKGMRAAEIVLFISGTGAGKSTLLREIVLHVLGQTEGLEPAAPLPMVGILSLEEAPAETTRKLSGMAINRNPAKDEIPIEELKEGFEKVFGDDRVIVLDHQGALDDAALQEQIEYMALCGCTHIMLDHITMVASEGTDDLRGNEAIDKIMNSLLRLVKKHSIWLGIVSHLRKSNNGKSFEEGSIPSLDDAKGSGSIKQVSFDVVAFARNMVAESEIERNTVLFRILKCRYTGLTGDVPGAIYNYDTGRLQYAAMEDFEVL